MAAPSFKKGDLLTAADLNALADLIVARVQGGKGINATVFGSQIIIENTKRDAPIGLPARYAVIVTVKKDVYLCQQWSFSTGAILVDAPVFIVAKPIELRGTTWEGKIRAGFTYASTDGTGDEAGHKTRDSDDSSTIEAQEVIPNWIESATVGTIIIAERVLGTGVTYLGNPVLWRDINEGARAWSKVFVAAPVG